MPSFKSLPESRPMGFLEKTSFLIHEGAEASTSISVLLKVQGALSFDIFKLAWGIMFKRHPLLHATIRKAGWGYFFDFNAVFEDIPLKEINTRNFDLIEQEYSEEIVKPFKISHYLWRATLVKESDTRFYILFGGLHTICDARSISWLLAEFLTVATDLSQQKTPVSDAYPIPPAYDDLIDRSRFCPTQEVPEAETLFFQSPVLPQDSRSHNILHALTPKQSASLLQRCRDHGVTITSALCAAFALAIFAAKLKHAPNLNMWTAFDLRPYTQQKTEQSVLAFYAHMLPFKLDLSNDPSFWDVAKQAITRYGKAIKAYQFGSLEDDASCEALTEGIQTHIQNAQFFVPYAVSNAGVLDAAFAKCDPHFKPEEFYFTVMNRALFGYLIFADSLNGRLFLNFNFTVPALASSTGEKLAKLTLSFLEEAIAESPYL